MFGSLRKLYRNTLFRLSLLGALLFVLSLFVVLGYVYYAVVQSELQRIDRSIEAEIDDINVVFREAGMAGVQQAKLAGVLPLGATADSPAYRQIYSEAAIKPIGRATILRGLSYDRLYFIERMYELEGGLISTDDSSQIGNLVLETTEPSTTNINVSDLKRRKNEVEFLNPTQGEEGELNRGRITEDYLSLEGRPLIKLVVGRNVESIMSTGERVRTAILTSSGFALLLGLLSSFFVSRRFARRVEGFNRLATDVRAGHLDRRAPRNYSEDEMDLLAEHLNAMLDHINRLMQAMRYAGDSVAHDLRTPLTRLRTRLESAAVELDGTDEALVLYEAAGDADQLLSTFDSVLRIARLEAGERRELLKTLDPKPILDDLAELYEPACEDAGLTFTADIASKTLISADRGLLSQAVSNLLENAIKYTPKGGSVGLVSRKRRGGGIEIAIVDDGPGIPSWDRERVKERFVRLDKSRSLPGSGLGLSLVEAVADLHQAEFVMSDNEDLPSVEKGGDPDRPGLRAALVFPRIKTKLTETLSAKSID